MCFVSIARTAVQHFHSHSGGARYELCKRASSSRGYAYKSQSLKMFSQCSPWLSPTWLLPMIYIIEKYVPGAVEPRFGRLCASSTQGHGRRGRSTLARGHGAAACSRLIFFCTSARIIQILQIIPTSYVCVCVRVFV